MSEILAKALRPKSFKTLFGQQMVTDAIVRQVKSGRVPSSWMFIGETGSGKTTIARIVARALNCRHKKPFGGFCKECVDNVDFFNIREVNASHFKGIDDAKELVEAAHYKPLAPARKRVFILDEAQELTRQAQNLLLKSFEDTPESSVFIICTTDPHKILPALQSRCKAATYAMQPLRDREVERFVEWAVQKAKVKVDADILNQFIGHIHKNDITSARNILGGLEQLISGIDPDRTLGSKSNIDTMAVCKGVINGEWDNIRPELKRATVDDTDYILASVLGYLRAMLLGKAGVKRRLVAHAIVKLTGVVSYGVSEPARFTTLCAVLHQLTEVFPDGKIR
jgi:DNA polymerase III subunit gamma/tau